MSFSFDPSGGLIVVPTRLHGPNGDIIAELALDTGATATILNWDIGVLLGYDPAAQQERVQLTTGSSVEYAPAIELSRIEALGKSRAAMRVLCHTFPPSTTVNGVLGLDFFRGWCLSIDFAKGTIALD